MLFPNSFFRDFRAGSWGGPCGPSDCGSGVSGCRAGRVPPPCAPAHVNNDCPSHRPLRKRHSSALTTDGRLLDL